MINTKHEQQCHDHQATTTHRAPNIIKDTNREDKEKTYLNHDGNSNDK
jgi:hypothetical protein